MQRGSMKRQVGALAKNQRVRLIPTGDETSDNIQWLASPEDSQAGDTLIDHADVDIDEEFIPHPSQHLSCFV